METFVLDLKSPLSEAPRLAQDGVRLLDEHTLEADITRDRSINFLFEELSRHNIEVLSMRNKTNRLEQLFVHMMASNGRSEGAQ
jgi:ABC-2 type transport system ATP-binding protein